MSHLAVRDASRPRSLRQSDIQTRLDSIPTVDPTQSALSFVLLFVHARDALVLADVASGRITRWNPAAEELFGYTLAQAVGRPIEMLMTPAVARLHHERVGHYLRTGETDILATRTPLGVPAVTSSGEEIRVELSMLPMEVPGVRAFSILFTFHDAGSEKCAELSALEASRAESARQETDARLRSCEALLRESPRDLERPVTRARRAAARMARVAADTETGPRRLALLAQVVESHAEGLQRSLDELADTAAIETGTFEVSTERVNLVPMVSRVVASARTRSSVHRLNFGAPQGLTAECDPRRIEGGMHDLIERAIRSNPRGRWIR